MTTFISQLFKLLLFPFQYEKYLLAPLITQHTHTNPLRTGNPKQIQTENCTTTTNEGITINSPIFFLINTGLGGLASKKPPYLMK